MQRCSTYRTGKSDVGTETCHLLLRRILTSICIGNIIQTMWVPRIYLTILDWKQIFIKYLLQIFVMYCPDVCIFVELFVFKILFQSKCNQLYILLSIYWSIIKLWIILNINMICIHHNIIRGIFKMT